MHNFPVMPPIAKARMHSWKLELHHKVLVSCTVSIRIGWPKKRVARV